MKRFGKNFWLLLGICVIALVLIVGLILYLAVFLPKQRENETHKRQVQQYRQAKTEQYIRENEAYGDYEVEVAFLGDSLTDLYDVAAYYPQYVTVNRGIGGDTTFDLEERLQVSVYNLKPQAAVLLIGANNVDTMMDNYEDILAGLKTNLPNTKVVVLSLTAMGGDHWGSKNQQAAYNNVSIKLLAEKYGFAFVDLFTPLYDVSTGEVYEGYTVDGGHLTPRGYEVVTAQITPVLETLLGK